jgi:hypothetical protein
LLENYNNKEYVNTNNELITIEHIFPRNPNDDWNKDLHQSEYYAYKEIHLNTIKEYIFKDNGR